MDTTLALQPFLFWIFGIVGILGVYIFKDFKQNTSERITKNESAIDKLQENRANNEKEIFSLTHSITDVVVQLSKLEIDFKEYMKMSQKALERREQYHDYIEKIATNLMTQNQMKDMLDALDKIANKIANK